MLNGDRFELAGAVTVSGLLAQLEIDPRRVAVGPGHLRVSF